MTPVDRQKTILIVDDEVDLRELLAFDFQGDGYNVLCAENGKTAFERVSEGTVDLVITDTRMPVCNGITLLKNIKQKNPHLPVIMFITEQADLSVEEAYSEGAEALFAKPFDRQALKSMVRDILAPRNEAWIRKGDRQNIVIPVKLGETMGSYKLMNIGRGGMFIGVEKGDFPIVGEQIQFTLSVPTAVDKLVEGTGIVRWVRRNQIKPDGFGLEFFEFRGEARGLILKFINSVTTKAYIPND